MRYLSSNKTSNTGGFTLIEMIVSLGLFSVVITIAVGALLVLINTNLQLQSEQTVMTNLSFALDSMTREIRTGTHYYCEERANNNGSGNYFGSGDLDSLAPTETKDCYDGRESTGGSERYQGVIFNEGGDSITTGVGSNRIMYFFSKDDEKLYRKVSDDAPQAITSDDIIVEEASFFVTGSAPQSETDPSREIDDQPAVTIVLTARAKNDLTNKSYVIQTTVTQRAIDI